MEQELYKARSLSSCFKTAYDVVFNNAKTIICKTWIVAIINAAIIALTPIVFQPTPLGLSLTAIVIIAAIIANALLLSKVATLQNGKHLKLNAKRLLSMSAVVTLCAIISIVVLIGIAVFTANWAVTAGSTTPIAYSCIAAAIIAIVLGIVWLPASYSCMNYIYSNDSKLTDIFGKPYATGFKSWGFLFMIHLMLAIISAILFILLFAIPITLTLADINNASSMALGDADGLPATFMPLYYISTFIAWLLMSYVCIWGHIVVYFAYGTLTYKQANKLPQTQTNNNEETTHSLYRS